MPLYYLLVGRRKESVLHCWGSMSIGAVMTAQSLDVYAHALPLCYTPALTLISIMQWSVHNEI